MERPVEIHAWHEEHKAQFAPPVCNKLMHKGQLSVMFVGGPNTREDFHLEDGSEFFWQIKGRMELPTIQKGKRKLVKIEEGFVFLLPSRVPHSPQRPVSDSLGLVIERERLPEENDALRFYTDFATCDRKLWERYFHCQDLGKDLVPVINAWKASEESKTREPTQDALPAERAIVENEQIELPEPFHLMTWVRDHDKELSEDGALLPLFPGHPDAEFKIQVEGARSPDSPASSEWLAPPTTTLETILIQLVGSSLIEVEAPDQSTTKHELTEGAVFVLKAGDRFRSSRAADARMMRLYQDPRGNRLHNSA
ncbi:3-hydroxyanthranilate 3,4-dioxygenase [Hondaea fermentalgiana]|uniref:3-hydroxyanthranilate 3,4-dioxygenase n=1 Tax=Hondaea fermentalgiana TaxID=2315210 RepID=A0A2R5GKD1_9STRA|nr:3-hydroxyanthranilate 3,4-dioxygenase [Hondaea fermentalgiana]|eukprot:GBG29083.1 3-hydroxyanthranilate 3,4-dioxygenase [Hondaea fermentalgiana]